MNHMEKLQLIIIGMVVWQALTFAAWAISDANEDIGLGVGLGVFGVPLISLVRLVYKFYKKYKSWVGKRK